MENYKLLLYGLIAGAAGLAAYAQTRRNPDEIMRDEKPTKDSLITTVAAQEALRIVKEKACRCGMKVYRLEQSSIVLASSAELFSWGYVLKIVVEKPNDWSSKVIFSLYSKAETGYGNRIVRNKKLKNFIKAVRDELRDEN